MHNVTVTPTRRERARAATLEEIKQTARALMRESGTADVRFTDIARVMGMTPPALYRYYAGRDQLLTELIAEAYDDLADTLARARATVPEDDLASVWVAVATAYREWARRDPQQFTLILGMPVPGYVAPDCGPTSEAADRAMSQLSWLFVEAARRGELRPPLLSEVDRHFAGVVAPCMQDLGGEAEPIDLPPETFQAMLHTWAALHGLTCLEIYGHLDWLDDQCRDALFRSQLRLMARTAGLPEPQ